MSIPRGRSEEKGSSECFEDRKISKVTSHASPKPWVHEGHEMTALIKNGGVDASISSSSNPAKPMVTFKHAKANKS